MDKSWVVNIRQQCQDADVPFFFKQWGGVRKSKCGRELDGRYYDEFPALHRNEVPDSSIRKSLAARFVDAWQSPPVRSRRKTA
jgi:hypothetical protein